MEREQHLERSQPKKKGVKESLNFKLNITKKDLGIFMFNFQSKQYKSRVKTSLTVRRLSFYLHRALVSSKCTVQPAERTLPNLRLPFNLKSMNLKSACEQTQCIPTVYHIMLQFCLLSLFQKNQPELN